MSIKAKYYNQNLEFYESSNLEAVHAMAPVYFYDDFLGADILLAESGSLGIWDDVITGSATVAAVDAQDNGCAEIALDSTSEAQTGALYWGDIRGIQVAYGGIFECRLKASVLPTAGSVATWGMCGDHNAVADSVAESAWFRLDGSGALDVESDDTTNNNDDVTTGITLLNTDWKVYRIDFTTMTDVKFYVDGVRVASGTTFDMSNLTSAESQFQPHFCLYKASGTSVGTLLIDYVRIWARRA